VCEREREPGSRTVFFFVSRCCALFLNQKKILKLICSCFFRADRMAQLLDERDLGVLTSVMSLFVSLVSNNAEVYWNCLPKCVRILERLARNQDVPPEYTYYGIPSPWLQVIVF
jgi:ribosomal protein L24E